MNIFQSARRSSPCIVSGHIFRHYAPEALARRAGTDFCDVKSATLAQQIDLVIRAVDHGVARLLGEPEHATNLNADKLPAPLARLAGDEDVLDMAGIGLIDDGASGVVERP